MNEQLVQALLHEMTRLNYNLTLLIEQSEKSNDFQQEVLKRLKNFDVYGVGTAR